MDFLSSAANILVGFVFVISVVVFIHELGHYIVAKLCGVRITAFSLGFGKELCGFTDRSGTRWKISLLPLGGYVKMFGDASAASNADSEALANMDAEERKVAFHYQPLYKKALVVVAGPLANFLLTICVLTYFIMANGLPSIEPVAGGIIAESAAAKAGLQPGDRILRIDDDAIQSFNDIVYHLSTNLGTEVTLQVKRGEKEFPLTLTPKIIEDDDGLGNKLHRALIGIKSPKPTVEYVGLPRAIGEAVNRTYITCASTLKAIGQIITGKRTAKDLRGTIGMAQLSGQAAEKGIVILIGLIATISANLGLVNLLPIPMLDGGWLVFYLIEAVRGRPMAEKVQEYSFRVGFGLIAALMLFTFINDIHRILS